MRVYRFMLVALTAANLLASHGTIAAEVQPVEHVVSSQIVSDTVVEGGVLESGVSTDGCPGGACGDGGSGGLGAGSLSGGGLRARLAGASGFAGDMGNADAMASGCVPRTYGYPDLFYNYYTQGNCNGTNAQMYLAPVPVPPNVGHTYYTYQPFMPQEMLYWHKDRFHNYYDGGRGMNHTKVHYYAPPVRQSMSNLYWNHIRIPR